MRCKKFQISLFSDVTNFGNLILKKISVEYIFENTWVGKGDNICTDPKLLHDNIAYNLYELGLYSMDIKTFMTNDFESFALNDSNFEWEKYFALVRNSGCIELSLHI